MLTSNDIVAFIILFISIFYTELCDEVPAEAARAPPYTFGQHRAQSRPGGTSRGYSSGPGPSRTRQDASLAPHCTACRVKETIELDSSAAGNPKILHFSIPIYHFHSWRMTEESETKNEK
jgi:hypothetical protein